ncbi:unnamed protein product [Pseudo-nitzschia multistriata]|uniref:PABS domain-containing protein n=1 Tax=Pseudo-nitzschia multistriata TaxID=183589 RepID=A0A448ZQ94_9STRA|nr:unnamed protein product [Pseudo-nitzschia multistriata]
MKVASTTASRRTRYSSSSIGRGRIWSVSNAVALWSAIALLLAGSSAGEQTCPEGSEEGSCAWDSLSALSPEQALVEWIGSMEQGSVASEKFRIERKEYAATRKPSDAVSEDNRSTSNKFEIQPRFEFYATEDIPSGTVLMEIPESAIVGNILNPSKTVSRLLEPKKGTKNHIPTCMLVESLVNEREKGADSPVHPYLEYIFGPGNPEGKQPSAWSEKGKFVFWGMMGQEGAIFKPNRYNDKHKHSSICGTYKRYSPVPRTIPISSHDKVKDNRENLENAAYSYVAKNAWGVDLIPLFDMIPHRNGFWKNVEAKFVEVESGETVEVRARDYRFEALVHNRTADGDDPSTKSYKLVVYADRDIQEGEPLHVSYNQCKHLGCEKLHYRYTAGNFMADGGFVEDYPRRWSLEVDPYESEVDPDSLLLIFDIDVDRKTGEKKFSMIQKTSEDEKLYEVNVIAAAIDRWNALEEEVKHHVVDLDSLERSGIEEFHSAYQEAFKMLWSHRNDPVVNQESNEKQYDDLDQPAGPGVHFRGEYMPCAEGEIVDGGNLLPDATVNGFYQVLQYLYEDEIDNTYIKMQGWLHSASNFRAHYHESAIHVPLQYVKDVKRVAYIGGGDNMVLEELLKYPNIELIVGMELDQQACRSSMKYFGTTPAYYDPRVEWWYGNAAKTLRIIPDDYFGSFDLVLVDLLNDVSEAIKVAVDLSLLEISPLLMKQDGGVISRNEDYVDRSAASLNMAQRVIAYEYWDVPRLCETSISIGSNSVDFAKGERYNHGVDPKLRLKSFDTMAHDGWSAYHDHSRPLDPEGNETAWTSFDPYVCDKIHRSLPGHKQEIGMGGGHLLVIEAENVTMTLDGDNSMSELQTKITDVAKRNGLSVVDSFHADSDPSASFLILDEGYIKARVYPEAQYVAFDLMMWGTSVALDKSNAIQEDLIAALGGGTHEGSTSSFRVTASGMATAEEIGETNGLVGVALDYYCSSGSDSTKDDDKVVEDGIQQEETFSESIIITEILGQPFDEDRIPSFAVFCGKEDAEECSSYNSIANKDGMNFYPVSSCGSFQDMPACQSATEKRLVDIVSENKKLDGVVLDRSLSLDMGKIIHKVFNNTLNQDKLLESTFVFLTPVPTGESWRKILLDRFRSEIIIVSPIMKADIDLYTEERSEEWSIVWARHHNFFHSLETSLATIEEKLGLTTTTKRVLPGAKPLKFDWNPRIINDSDYYNPERKEQWLSQRPVGYQYFVQMELATAKAPVEVNEIVYVATRDYSAVSDGFKEDFVKATVLEVEDDKYVIEMMTEDMHNGTIRTYKPHNGPVGREMIRKISSNEGDRKYTVGDIVLVQQKDKDTGKYIPIEFYSAYVTGLTEAGIATRPHNPDADVAMLANVPHEFVMVYAESPEFSTDHDVSFSREILEEAFKKSAVVMGLTDEGDAATNTFEIGKGIVVTLLSSIGSFAMKWDGLYGIELNIFTHNNFGESLKEIESQFMEQFKHLAIVAKDSFPRGYGKVVNFEHEIERYDPHWIDDEPSEVEDGVLYEYLDDDEYIEE